MVAKATAPRRENVPKHILFHSLQSPPPLQGVARLAGYNPLTPDSVSRRPDFLFVQVTIALDALLMPLEGAFVLLRLNP